MLCLTHLNLWSISLRNHRFSIYLVETSPSLVATKDWLSQDFAVHTFVNCWPSSNLSASLLDASIWRMYFWPPMQPSTRVYIIIEVDRSLFHIILQFAAFPGMTGLVLLSWARSWSARSKTYGLSIVRMGWWSGWISNVSMIFVSSWMNASGTGHGRQLPNITQFWHNGKRRFISYIPHKSPWPQS